MKRKITLSLADILESMVWASRGGHQDSFIPEDADVRAELKERPAAKLDGVQVVIEWEDGL